MKYWGGPWPLPAPPLAPPLHAPAALCLRHHPAAQQVPAVPAQELGRRGHHGRGVPRARRRHLAVGELLPARGLWSRDGAHLVLGTRNGGSPLVCLRRRVPGDVEGILSFSVRGLEGHHQVVRGVWCHALVRLIPRFVDDVHGPQSTFYLPYG